MRAFALGLIAGAGICYAAIKIAAPSAVTAPPPEPASAPPLAARETHGAPSCPEVPSVAAANAAPSAEKNIQTNTTEARAPAASPETAAPPVRKRISLDDLTDKEATELCMAAAARDMRRERERKEAEAKDTDWAYAMEQLISQHVMSRLVMDQHTKVRVDCRTTYCEMNIDGRGDDAHEFASKLGNQIANQPWSDVVNISQSTQVSGDGWRITQEWFRPRTDAERRQWGRPAN